MLFRKLCCKFSSTFAKDQEIGKRIAAEAVGSVKSRATFYCGEKTGNRGHLRLRIHADTTHDVVRCRSNFHWRSGDIDVRELFELVIHARELAFDVFRRVRKFFLDPRNIKKHAAVRTAAS